RALPEPAHRRGRLREGDGARRAAHGHRAHALRERRSGLRAPQQAPAGRGRSRDHRPSRRAGRDGRRGGLLERQAQPMTTESALSRAPGEAFHDETGAARIAWRRALRPWLFLAPALALLGAFTFWPVLWGGYLAFPQYNFLTPPRLVGLANFEDLLEDSVFFISMRNSLLYLLIVPAIQLGAIALAVLVNNALPGIKFFRAAFYTPVVTSVSVVGIMWGWMYNEQG